LRYFRNGPELKVENFYYWAYGDVFTNIIRAAIAEYLVACALCLDHAKRSSWDGYDFVIEGIRLEVKSSACFVSGKCPTKSNTYDIEPRANSWHPDGTLISADGSARRCADVYVFAHHWSTDREAADTLDVSQWHFYVVPTPWIDESFGNQKRISRDKVARHYQPTPYAHLRAVILRMGRSLGA
jgi:hypothetical protein